MQKVILIQFTQTWHQLTGCSVVQEKKFFCLSSFKTGLSEKVPYYAQNNLNPYLKIAINKVRCRRTDLQPLLEKKSGNCVV